MESHSNFHYYSYLSDHNQVQNGSVYDGLIGDSVAEAGLDVRYLQPVSVFETENGNPQSTFTSDFTSPQSSSHNTFGYTGNSSYDFTWVPQEATEAYNWLPTSDAIGMAKSPRAAVLVPSCNIRPQQIISPSSITSQQLGREHMKPPVYGPRQGFVPLLDGESGGNPLSNNSLFVPSTPFLT